MAEQLNCIASMRADMSEVRERREELERLAVRLAEEKETLSTSLETAAARILQQEKRQKDQDYLIRDNARELDELKVSSMNIDGSVLTFLPKFQKNK